MIIFNEETEDIDSEKHICYYTINNYQSIILMEVFEKKLKHPEAKEHAYVYKFDTRKIKEFDRIGEDASSSILLEAAQNNMKIVRKEGD
ncbi:hypothetical protein HN385_06185 [archaeon]|jgi:hypothetical protein|nr:hypothetical protein [archaeon]